MRYDQNALMEAQRRAFTYLTSDKDNNKYYTDPNRVTESAQLIQEIPFTNGPNSFQFNFASTAPPATPILGNVNLGKTQVFAIYAVQLLIGQGANANTRIYRSRGVTSNDDSIYNSIFQMQAETNVYIDDMNGHNFRDVATNANEFWSESGMTLINPIRVVNGELGKFFCSINLINSIAGVVLTDNLFLSLRLHGALGQARG